MAVLIAVGGAPASTNARELAAETLPAATDAVLLAAGDIASCVSTGDEATALLLDANPGTVATLGDNVYESGTPTEFAECYEPTWGRAKDRTRPSVGNHEYKTPGASGYFNYFGAAAGEPGEGYYSYDVGSWHLIALNSNCSQVGCWAGSAQEQLLRADLAAHPAACTIAYSHHPRFSSGYSGGSIAMQPLWNALYEHGAEVFLAGHDHLYERFAPQTPSGQRDDLFGIRQFIVGTGGRSLSTAGTPTSNSEVLGKEFGVLKLTLGEAGYEWKFLPVAGKTFTDSGSGVCHSNPPPPPPDTTPPDTVITSGPSGVVASTSASFKFSASESTSKFECALDGRPFAPCGSPKWYGRLGDGPHEFSVRATDSAGNTDPTPASRSWTVDTGGRNLLSNGSFEGTLAEWRGYRAALSLVGDGTSGTSAARVALNEAASLFSIYASPRTVSWTNPGVAYAAGASLRSATPGRKVCLRVREWAPSGALAGAAARCLTAASGWQAFARVVYTTVTRTGSLSVDVYEGGALAGDSFDVDAVTLSVP